MFVDELTIYAKAGDGGSGAVRWLRLRAMAEGGPAGGDGGRGGNVYLEAVRNLTILGKYTHSPRFLADNGEPGRGNNEFGANGEDCVIRVPIGSRVTNQETGQVYELTREGERVEILHGGNGGYGNAHFKSSIVRSPDDAIPGQKMRGAYFHIELMLPVDVGLIGLPNAGKSTLLNTLTNAESAVGAYPFTTLEPHLGDFYGHILADIPGLIEGAAEGKGLGHKFLRHTGRARMLLHLVSAEETDPVAAYRTVRSELEKYNSDFLDKEEWIVLTKTDALTDTAVAALVELLQNKTHKPVYPVCAPLGLGTQELQDALTRKLQSK